MIQFKLIFWTALWLAVCMAPVLGHGDPPGRETEDSQRPELVRANDTTDPPQKDQPSPLTAPFDEATAKAAQKTWAKYLGKVRTIRTNSLGMQLTLIPPGEFLMGNFESIEDSVEFAHKHGLEAAIPKTFADEHPQHRVRITRPFYLGTHEVTIGQFRMFVAATGHQAFGKKGGWGYVAGDEKSPFKQNSKFTWHNWGIEQNDNFPVVNVVWNDAAAFCTWLSEREGVTYRLPTEAEWEYACRAGTTTRYSFGDDPEGLVLVGNVADTSVKARWPWFDTVGTSDGYAFTCPVGSFRPNSFGLHDMHGNVWEWCADWYGADYYKHAEINDPTGPSSGTFRMSRGGGWDSCPGFHRSAERGGWLPSRRLYDLGFRVVRNTDE